MRTKSRSEWLDQTALVQIYSQRSSHDIMTIIAVLSLVIIAGCAGGAGGDSSNPDSAAGGIAPSTNETEQQAMGESDSTATTIETTTVVPQPEMLDSTLHRLVVAKNQTAFARQRGLNTRNGTVLVTIETTSESELPPSITAEVRARSGNEILAYVGIKDLTRLTQNDTIKAVRVPQTGNTDTNQPN